MGRLLYIESSPRKKRSVSIEVAKVFLDEYQQSHSADEVQTIDLWNRELPRFDGDVIESKYAILHGQSHTEAQRKAWRVVEQLIQEFKHADKYLFSIPMWNFGIPYVLKHYIDLLVQPSYTFSFSPSEGYKGLVTGKSAAIIYARGGAYGSGTGAESLDLQKTYMETILKFIGIEKIETILVEPTLGATAEEKTKIVNKAKEQAQHLADRF